MRGGTAVTILAAGLVVASAWLAGQGTLPGGSAEGPSPQEGRRAAEVNPGRELSGTPARGPAPATGGRGAAERGRIQATEITSGFYQVQVRGLRALLDEPRRALGALGVGAWPTIGPAGRPALEISSDLADGILTREGLMVTDPKGLALAGVEAGDILRTVNGHPLSHLHLALVELRREPDPRLVRLELDRGGARIVRAYDIRGL